MNNQYRNFTNPNGLQVGMQVRDSDEDIIRTVKSTSKHGNAWQVDFEDGDSFFYDSNDQFEVITSDTTLGEDFDVFMLMEYTADTGPDTMGMEGDTFNCLGKFFATDLESAKKELASILEQHPELKEICPGLYVSEYIESFDSPTREEQDEYGNPYDVDNNVFADLQALVDRCFDWDYINSWAQGMADDDELPFSIEDTFSPADDNFALHTISNTLDSISLDPDYSETIEDIRWASDPDSGVYTIKLYFWDGGYSLIDIDPVELESQIDYNQASKLVRDRVDNAINEYGG